MARFRVRDVDALRRSMESSQRIVPHSVRSLADQVGANRSKIGYLLTGERSHVDEALAKRIAEVLMRPVSELFAPEGSSSEDEASERTEPAPVPANAPSGAPRTTPEGDER